MLSNDPVNSPDPREEGQRELVPVLKEYGFSPAGPTNWALRDTVAVSVHSDMVGGSVHTVEVYAATEGGLVDPSNLLGFAQNSSHDQAIRDALDEAGVEPVDGDQS